MSWTGISNMMSPQINGGSLFSPPMRKRRTAKSAKVPFADVTNGPSATPKKTSTPVPSEATNSHDEIWEKLEAHQQPETPVETGQESEARQPETPCETGEEALYLAVEIDKATDELWDYFEHGETADASHLHAAKPVRTLLSGLTLLVTYILIVAAATWGTFQPEHLPMGHLTHAAPKEITMRPHQLVLDSWDF